jgi:predicted protein tyrosine phosphatase
MTLDEEIYQSVQKLSQPFREKLLEFAKSLLQEQSEREAWNMLSLHALAQSAEDEPELYSEADIKIRFQDSQKRKDYGISV